jgi:hypothetical protein
MAAVAAEAPAWRHAVLKHLDGYDAVAGIDAADVLAQCVVVTMLVIVYCNPRAPLILPSPPRHPDCDGDNDRRRGGWIFALALLPDS